MSEPEKLLYIVTLAIAKFNAKERYLMENDLSERCICAKFAMYLQAEFDNSDYKDFVVDVEYNRGFEGREISPKRLHDKKIVVDLIVHKRGYHKDYGFINLLCIEMKKSTDKRGCEADEDRLRDMTNYAYGFCYKLGLMIVANMDDCNLIIKNCYTLN